MKPIFELLKTKAPISLELQALFDQNLKITHVNKGDTLLKIGVVATKFYYIEKGLLRLFFFNSKGREITSWFSKEEEFTTSFISFIEQKPSILQIEALEDTEVYIIEKSFLEAVIKEYPIINELYLTFIQQHYLNLEKAFQGHQSESAIDRYQDLLENQAYIFQRVNLGMIASFLGMNPATLSRIRGIRPKN
jgi:CRP/FNR family transcriptional regulator, anaerobic regulatory protein